MSDARLETERARKTFLKAMRALGLDDRAQIALLAAAGSWVKAIMGRHQGGASHAK